MDKAVDNQPPQPYRRSRAKPAPVFGAFRARADELLDKLRVTVDPRAQIPLRREHVQTLMTDIALMPVYWEVQPSVMTAAVKGDISPTNPGWNVFTWGKG